MQNVTAIIFDKKGNILSVGKNSYTKTHPLQFKHAKRVGLEKKIYLHAELDAIIKCKDLTKAHTIKVFRYFKNGKPANAKPCPICTDAIRFTPIKNIEHT